MGGEFTVSTIVNQENLAVAKTVCSGFKAVLVDYKKNSMTYKAEVERIKNELEKNLAEQRMKNSTALYVTNMKQIQLFMRSFDIKSMDSIEEKLFYRKLERLNDELDFILEQYSKGMC